MSFEVDAVLGQKIPTVTKWAIQKPRDHFFVLLLLMFTLEREECFQLESLYLFLEMEQEMCLSWKLSADRLMLGKICNYFFQ